MNRISLRPLTSLLVLCFMLVSVVSRSAGSAADGATACTLHVPTSHAAGKRFLQLIIEEKEGEKGSDKSAALHTVLRAYSSHAALIRSNDIDRTISTHLLFAALPRYLINRSLVI
jgi:hypothetical protein